MNRAATELKSMYVTIFCKVMAFWSSIFLLYFFINNPFYYVLLIFSNSLVFIDKFVVIKCHLMWQGGTTIIKKNTFNSKNYTNNKYLIRLKNWKCCCFTKGEWYNTAKKFFLSSLHHMFHILSFPYFHIISIKKFFSPSLYFSSYGREQYRIICRRCMYVLYKCVQINFLIEIWRELYKSVMTHIHTSFTINAIYYLNKRVNGWTMCINSIYLYNITYIHPTIINIKVAL